MLSKLLGFVKKENSQKSPSGIKKQASKEPKTNKIELISKLINNLYKDSKEIFDDQESITKEDNFSNVLLKIKIHSNKETKNINSVIISKNTLLINTTETPNKVDILSLKKSFYNKTEKKEEGFISIIVGDLLFISFFVNLFEYYLGLEKNRPSEKVSNFIVCNGQKIVVEKENQINEEFPVFYIKNNLVYLNGFYNNKGKCNFYIEKVNLILKAIYFGNSLIDDKYRDFNNLNLNEADCGSMGIQILIQIYFPNLKILKLNGSKMTSKSILLFNHKMFSNLTELDLSNNYIGDTLIENLEKSNLINLTKLNISNNEISNKGLKIFSSKNFINLIELDLSHNLNIDDDGIIYLKDSQLLHLKSLNLEFVNLNYKGFDYLINLPFSNIVETLSLYLTKKIKYDDISKISQKLESNLKNLKHLTYIRGGKDELKFSSIIIGFSSPGIEVFSYLGNLKDIFLNPLGIDKAKKQIISDLKIKVNATFWITASQDRFRSIPKKFYQNSDAIMLCFDINDKSSFEFVNKCAIDLVNGNTNIPFAYFAKKGCYEDKDIINKLHEKIFYYDDENKTGIDAGIGYLADKFIKKELEEIKNIP